MLESFRRNHEKFKEEALRKAREAREKLEMASRKSTANRNQSKKRVVNVKKLTQEQQQRNGGDNNDIDEAGAPTTEVRIKRKYTKRHPKWRVKTVTDTTIRIPVGSCEREITHREDDTCAPGASDDTRNVEKAAVDNDDAMDTRKGKKKVSMKLGGRHKISIKRRDGTAQRSEKKTSEVSRVRAVETAKLSTFLITRQRQDMANINSGIRRPRVKASLWWPVCAQVYIILQPSSSTVHAMASNRTWAGMSVREGDRDADHEKASTSGAHSHSELDSETWLSRVTYISELLPKRVSCPVSMNVSGLRSFLEGKLRTLADANAQADEQLVSAIMYTYEENDADVLCETDELIDMYSSHGKDVSDDLVLYYALSEEVLHRILQKHRFQKRLESDEVSWLHSESDDDGDDTMSE